MLFAIRVEAPLKVRACRYRKAHPTTVAIITRTDCRVSSECNTEISLSFVRINQYFMCMICVHTRDLIAEVSA